jgi:hypothetical protein
MTLTAGAAVQIIRPMKEAEAQRPGSRPLLIKLIEVAVLGVFALVGVCVVHGVAAPKPKVDLGRLDFEGFEHGPAWAGFVYHPPQTSGQYWVHYKCVDVATGKELTRETSIVVDNPPVVKGLDHFQVLVPTNAVWRVTARVMEKRRNSWGAPHLYALGSIASQPITNRLPGTITTWPRQ